MPTIHHKLSEIKDGTIHFKILYTLVITKGRKKVKKLSVASVVDYGFPDLFYFDQGKKQFYTLRIKPDNRHTILEKNYLNNTYTLELVKQKLISEINDPAPQQGI